MKNNTEFNKEYWQRQGGRVEQKHYKEANDWIDYFQPDNALVVGCGLGHRVFTMNYYEVPTQGCDVSEHAIKQAKKVLYPNLEKQYKVASITELPYEDNEFDFIICYDVMEHLDLDMVEKAFKEMHRVCKKNIIFSICMTGDPNFRKDPTHKIYRSRAWWVHKIKEAGFEMELLPGHFWFKSQLIGGRKKN